LIWSCCFQYINDRDALTTADAIAWHMVTAGCNVAATASPDAVAHCTVAAAASNADATASPDSIACCMAKESMYSPSPYIL